MEILDVYSDRLKVVNEVENLKEKLSKQPLSDSTKRSKVTYFIAQKKSREEFEPPLGHIIDKTRVEPLHLNNNACALTHWYLCLKFLRFPIYLIPLNSFITGQNTIN